MSVSQRNDEPDDDGHPADMLGIIECWCGARGTYSELFADNFEDDGCGGSGVLYCHCGGDQCVCHHHGEVECPGCEECEGGDDMFYEDDMSYEEWNDE